MKPGLQRTILLFALFLTALGGILFCIATAHTELTPYTITRETVSATVTVSEGISEEKEIGERVNLNTASLEELISLPGIGETLAGRILAYREEHGSFQDTTQLREVEGIGDKKLEALLPYICV